MFVEVCAPTYITTLDHTFYVFVNVCPIYCIIGPQSCLDYPKVAIMQLAEYFVL